MIMQGMINVLIGFSAVFNSDRLLITDEHFVFLDLTSWGWWHIILGVVVLLAGFSVMQGKVWARTVGVLGALISAVGAMATVDAYPWWSLVLLTIDILIIYALIVHGHELKEE